jgi:predicted aconitase with swiveling domain
MDKFILKGRLISGGKAEGEALVTKDPIVFNLGIDAETGTITEQGHELRGQSVTGKILVFPFGKGSTGGAYTVFRMGKKKTGPKAMICQFSEILTTIGSMLGEIPVVDQISGEGLAKISTGDRIVVNADEGKVEIFPAGNR